MAKKAIIFDLDGTLVDSKPEVLFAFAQAWRDTNAAPLDINRVVVGPPLSEIYRNAYGDTSRFDAFQWNFRRYYDSVLVASMLYPQVKDTLELMKSGGAYIYCATFKPFAPASRILTAKGIYDIFDAVLAVDCNVPPFKSKEEMIKVILDAGDFKPGECLFVGDSQCDYDGAAICGVDFVLAVYGYGSVECANKIYSFSEVIKFV